MAAACIAAAGVAALAFSLFYVVFVREQYVAYEESGVYVETDTLKTKEEYQCFYGFENPDDKGVLFIYLSTTPYQKHQKREVDIEMFHMSDADNKINSIYYIPQEYVKDFRDYENGLSDEKREEIKDIAPLLWTEN